MGRMSSKKPNVQRKRQFGAPLHQRWKRLHARLDKPLREKYGKNATTVHKGDTVRMMRGTAIINDNVTRHVDAKVAEVDLKRGRLFLENVTRKTAKGKQVWVPIDPSNVIITKLDLGDARRRERLEAGKE
jgi:large subunit ribosomal protein L24